jgi:aspartyl-tRNA(Asn)/glutamyl-tRNA(Gln) amidotransferase subunit A
MTAAADHDVLSLARALRAGQTSSRSLTEAALARIEDPAGEGVRAFVRVDRDTALATADAMDRLIAAGVDLSPLMGLPVSIKDLFDIARQPTPAGSVALADAPPAERDAPAVARLRAAGAVLVGRTNMTEFAFSALGLNPHYGTPASPWDRATRRLPGGSSSGAAVSVSDGMAVIGLGTDTAASCRVPAAFCGITGFKPTARRIPTAGTIPLAQSLDSIGSLARTVSDCAIADAILAAEPVPDLAPVEPAQLRLAVATTLVQDDLEPDVAAAFERALTILSRAGVTLADVAFPDWARLPQINRMGGFPALEAFAWHRELLARAGDRYDPIIAARIRRGGEASAADYIDLLNARAELIASSDRLTVGFDAVVMPTLPMVPPPIARLEADAKLWLPTNLRALRNTAVANFLDRCAISLPCHRPDEPPVGLMLMGETMGDHHLLRVARTVELALQTVTAVSDRR